MIIDVHAHHIAPWLDIGRPVTDWPTLEARLSMMTEAGVGRQVLSCPFPFYREDEAESADLARRINDNLSEQCRLRPDVFSFWASLPLPHMDAALAELRRVQALPGYVGVFMHCFIQEISVADERFEPLYAEMDRSRGVILLHPVQNGLGSCHVKDWGLTVCAGASMEDAVVGMHLIARQIPQRFPGLRFIIPHFGGLLPMLLNRLDGQMPQPGFSERPSVTARRFYYDTVGWGSKAALLAAAEAFGSERLVPGSDFPILLHWESYAQTFRNIQEGGLAAEAVEQILHRNAQALLQIG